MEIMFRNVLRDCLSSINMGAEAAKQNAYDAARCGVYATIHMLDWQGMTITGDAKDSDLLQYPDNARCDAFGRLRARLREELHSPIHPFLLVSSGEQNSRTGMRGFHQQVHSEVQEPSVQYVSSSVP